MEKAIILKKEDILEAIKQHFQDTAALEINLTDEKIVEKIGYICAGEAVPHDYNVFPVI